MHELPVTKSILNICEEEVKKHGMEKVLAVNIRVGELTGLVPSGIEYYFDIIAKGTVAQGAKINIKKIPINIECKDCGESFECKKGIYNCINCSSHNIKITGGREFLIDTLEMD